MARSGLNSGMSRGLHQGVKTGLAMSNMSSGLNGGVVSSIWDKSKMQNPTTLSGIKKPIIFCLADELSQNTGTVITMRDLVGSGFSLTNNQGSSPTPDLVVNGIFGHRDYLDFNNGTSSLIPTPSFNFGGDTEVSFMMVVKVKPVSAKTLLYVVNELTPGGIDVSTVDTIGTLRSTYRGGQGGAITSSIYDTFLSPEEASDWMILTCKYRLKLPGGQGSEQEIHVNGRLQKKLFSTNFTIITTSMTAGQTLIVGNSAVSGGTRGNGIHLGAFLMLDYWLNESEQLRLENYFRWYYGNSF
jgi:hypothetical protein